MNIKKYTIPCLVSLLISPMFIFSDVRVGIDLIVNPPSPSKNGFRLFIDTQATLFNIKTIPDSDNFKTDCLDKFLSKNNRSINVTEEIITACRTYIVNYKYDQNSAIAKHLGKTNTDEVKAALNKALDRFDAVFKKQILEPLQNAYAIKDSSFQQIQFDKIKDEVEASLDKLKNTTLQEQLARSWGVVEQSFNTYRIPAFNIVDNYSDIARIHRVMYKALKELGETFGFTMEKIDSWPYRIYGAATNRWFWMVVASAGLVAGGYWLGKAYSVSPMQEVLPTIPLARPQQLPGVSTAQPITPQSPSLWQSFTKGLKGGG